MWADVCSLGHLPRGCGCNHGLGQKNWENKGVFSPLGMQTSSQPQNSHPWLSVIFDRISGINGKYFMMPFVSI